MECCCSCSSEVETVELPETSEEIKDLVRDKYSSIATSGPGTDCCSFVDGYEEVQGYVAEADLGLGCGIPVDHAGLKPGKVVLDLGSGAGLDVFVARKIVGEEGTVIGLDFSEAMIAKARSNAEGLGYSNTRFVHGDIEEMPVDDDSIDVVISNCVLNLVPSKEKAFGEIFRVLRPGGHFTISDVVLESTLPEKKRRSVESYVGCVAGALERELYLGLLREAGFEGVEEKVVRKIPNAPGALSVTVYGSKP